MELKACVFDASGVLIDDVNAIYTTSNKILEESNIHPVSFEDFQSRTKIPFWEYYKSFGLTEDESRATDIHFRKLYPRYLNLVKLYPEVVEVLEMLKSKGIKMGIVTHLPTFAISQHLDVFGVKDFFDSVVAFEDTDEHKPSAKPLLIALSKLNIEPSDSVFVGDMIQDILTGKRAGVKTVAVIREKNPYQTKEKLLEYKPDYLISNLSEIFSTGVFG